MNAPLAIRLASLQLPPLTTPPIPARPPRHVVVVGCGSLKLDRSAPASELYASTLFRLSLAYARQLAPDRDIRIASALHHLVQLDDVLAPYDARMTGGASQAWGAACARQFAAMVGRESWSLTLLLGQRYAAPLRHELRWARNRPVVIDEPLFGLQIGERLRFLSGATR